MNATTREAETANGWKQIRSMQFPELERHDCGDSLSFSGSKDALKSAGLVPDGTLFPDECEAKRGVRWRSDTGRRFTLSKGWGPVGTFRWTVYATPEEKRQMTHATRVAREVESLDKSMRSIEITEHEYRESVRRIVGAIWHGVLSDSGKGQDLWAYSPEVLESMQEHFEEIQRLICHGTVVRTPEALNALKARKAALQNEQLQSWIATLRA